MRRGGQAARLHRAEGAIKIFACERKIPVHKSMLACGTYRCSAAGPAALPALLDLLGNPVFLAMV